MTKNLSKTISKIAIGILSFLILAFMLLGSVDAGIFYKWLLWLMFLGVISIPFTTIVLPGHDIPFLKIVGIIIPGFIIWVLGIVFHVPFTRTICIIIPILVCMTSLFIQFIQKKSQWSHENYHLYLKQYLKYEAIFFVMFLLWTYLISFNASAYGTEKFMDYGFIQNMVTSTKLPPDDIWYAGEPINYYYGGQFYAAFLAKLTNTKAEFSYNMVRALIPALTFTSIFGLVEQILSNNLQNHKKISFFAVLSACIATFGGNGHYIVYGILKPLFQIGQNNSYWFPDSTRYIGYNPFIETDQTIHEFPSYSFILGDLHAHMLNIIVVILILALLFNFLQDTKIHKSCILYPQLYCLGVAWGICHWTNYWDFIIYLVVISITIIFKNKTHIMQTCLQVGVVIITGLLSALPFTYYFKSVFKGVGVAAQHSAIYQLIILWGLPIVLSIIFIITFIYNRKKTASDIFMFILSCCGIGLVMIPEFIYVKDIYEATHARANTMFKLTYQAFLMFSICSGYILAMLLEYKQQIMKAVCYILTAIQILTLGYFINAINSWFFNNPQAGLNALSYLEEDDFREDKEAILWLKEKAEKRELKGVLAEAPGDSYTSYNRVSVITGIPTIIGWTVHEWLWRDNYDNVIKRIQDVDSLYTNSIKEAKKVIDQYHITYIFFGQKEKEKYGEKQQDHIKQLGTVIYNDTTAIIVKVS